MHTTDETSLYRWIAQLQERGHFASKQRILIMTALCTHKEINDMESFWLALRQEHRISWATFYSFIRLAVKEKWISKLGNTSTYARYELLL